MAHSVTAPAGRAKRDRNLDRSAGFKNRMDNFQGLPGPGRDQAPFTIAAIIAWRGGLGCVLLVGAAHRIESMFHLQNLCFNCVRERTFSFSLNGLVVVRLCICLVSVSVAPELGRRLEPHSAAPTC